MKNITKALHRALTYTLSISIIWSGLLAAQEGNQLFIPIGVGDITTFIPVLGAPGSINVVEDTQPIGESVYQVSWSAVGNATYYQINVTDENGQITSFTTTDLDYDLSGLPLGTSTVQLLACNSNDQCGAAADLGTYTVNERIRYAYADVLGSPILETDQAGNAIAEFHYKPFGETEEEKQEDIGYTGHLEDTDLALTYMQARYYDPVIGRFYGNDPVGYAPENAVMSFNRYMYVNNNPYSYTDPDGEFLLQAAGVVGGAILGVGVQAVSDAIRGERSTLGSYLGAAAGGAAAGLVATTTFNPAAASATAVAVQGAAAGAVGGIVGSSTQQAVDTGQVNLGDVAKDAVIGAGVGLLAPGVKVPGITSGRNSFQAIASSADTKLANGTISTISTTTAAKAVTASVVDGSAGAAAGAAVEAAADSIQPASCLGANPHC